MSDRSDYLRSLLRGAGQAAQLRLRAPLDGLRKTLRTVWAQAMSVDDCRISQALTRIHGVAEASAVCRDGKVWIEATSSEGLTIRFSLDAPRAHFAPHGAKELSFRIEPAEAAERTVSRDLVGAVAALVAHTLWGPVLGRDASPDYDAIVDRDGSELRVDLRTVPAVRTAVRRGMGQLLELLELGGLDVESGALRLRLKLPLLLSAP